MKYYFILLFILFTSIKSIGQHKYIPLIGPNKYWFNIQTDGGDIPRSTGAFLLTIGKDTIINGVNYSKLMYNSLPGHHPCQFPPCFYPYIHYQINSNLNSTIAYLREDTSSHKVFCLPAINFYQFCDENEHLLYDFNQKVGDTLSSCLLKIFTQGVDIRHSFTIDSIKTEELYGKMRKVLYFQGFIYGGLQFIQTMRLVEGVGIETETTGFYLDSSVSFFAYCEGTLDECNIISSTKDNQTEHLEKIEIYQNPTDDNIHIEFSKNNLFQRVFLSDHFGTNLIEKTIYGENTINLDVSKLPAGLYFINFINNKTIHVEKVFISK